jgi:hypothetical protein
MTRYFNFKQPILMKTKSILPILRIAATASGLMLMLSLRVHADESPAATRIEGENAIEFYSDGSSPSVGLRNDDPGVEGFETLGDNPWIDSTAGNPWFLHQPKRISAIRTDSRLPKAPRPVN